MRKTKAKKNNSFNFLSLFFILSQFALDDLEWNLWVIKTEEWIEYYKQQAIEVQEESLLSCKNKDPT